MPEAETQTEDFIIIPEADLKKLPLADRKQYKIDLKNYNKKLAKAKKTIYMREYMNTYSKMKTKYDPAFRARKIINDVNYKARKKLLKEQSNQEAYEDETEEIENNHLDTNNLLTNNFLNARF